MIEVCAIRLGGSVGLVAKAGNVLGWGAPS
jgi:hypothetical protein